MTKYKKLYNILMYPLFGVIFSYWCYKAAVHLNPQNALPINKSIKAFLVSFILIGMLLRKCFKLIVEMTSDDTTIEDEMRAYFMNDTNEWIKRMQKREKNIKEFKFFK